MNTEHRQLLLVPLVVLLMYAVIGNGISPQAAHARETQSETHQAASIGTIACPYGVTNTQVMPNLIPDMQTLQSCWVRLQINAKDIGSDPYTNWQKLDGYIQALHNAGIHIDAVMRCFKGTDCFQNPATSILPTPQQVKDFATALAERYGTMIDSYEVLNEEYDNVPNSMLPNYCGLLQAGYTAIKAVEPTATVGMYGTYKVNPTHLPLVVQALQSCTAYMDYANMHYYAGGGDPNNPIQGQLSFTQAVNMLKQLGKPIWVTETGWPISNANIVKYMNEELDDARTSGVVTHVFWYTLDFPQQNPPQPKDIHYSTAAFNAMKNYIAAHPTWP
jgi:hypothetical protein